MLYLIDTANLEDIRRVCEYYPVAGVTTNPTIISREKADFKQIICEIRNIIGDNKQLHVQTTATEAKEILREAEMIRSTVGGNFFIKIPITKEGLRATEMCKKMGIGVTMTAIFTQPQALMAARAGADFVAPYINRLDNIVSDGVNVVNEIVDIFKVYDIKTQVLAASFKNVEQVHKVSMTGAHAVTINPDLFDMMIYHPLTYYAIDDFTADWQQVYGEKSVCDLL
ncbi:MAG: fructose-6-phosphate aldolase [Clostridia bacterium]|nr:fructose-6-phosphate aldolase [Clostridia bacterium]MBQ8513024.1 fructose-6-phosphate aldolase [Clostridia bacterium]